MCRSSSDVRLFWPLLLGFVRTEMKQRRTEGIKARQWIGIGFKKGVAYT